MSSANKLVDKYQYNQAQVRQDGLAELITAKHIVLKQLFTLKKVCISNKKTLARYHGVMNQMNILKTLGEKPYIFKCHKMLKTSNNLYVVYDLIGKNQTLAKMIETKQLDTQMKSILSPSLEKTIAIEIMKVLKQLKSLNIFYLDCNAKLIQVDDLGKIRFTNLQNAIFSNKNSSSLSFLNVQVSSDLAPQLKEMIEDCCSLSHQKDIDYTLFNSRLSKVDLFAFGKILSKIFEAQIDFSQKSTNSSGQFQRSLKKLIQRLIQPTIHERPSFEEIQEVLSKKNDEQKVQEDRNPSTRVSRRQKNKILDMSKGENEMKKSKSLIKSRGNNAHLGVSQCLLPGGLDDDFDTRSVKSSANFTESTTISKLKIAKKNTSFQMESEDSFSTIYRGFVLKVMKRRSLCRFLLGLAEAVFELQLLDRIPRIMLAFMFVKKSVLLICSLARFISTGKGQTEQFLIQENARKEFAKTNDFFRLSVAINKEMDMGRLLYQNTISNLNSQFSELSQTKEYNFVSECKSQNINQNFMKSLIKRSISQIVNKLQTPIKFNAQPIKQNLTNTERKMLTTSHRPSQNYLRISKQQIDNRMLRTTTKSNKSNNNINNTNTNFLEIEDDATSVVSARTIRTRLSRQVNNSGQEESFNNDYILRNIQSETLINVYMMGLILDFESYQKMFQNLIDDEKIEFGEQSLLRKLKKMQPKQIAQKMAEMLH